MTKNSAADKAAGALLVVVMVIIFVVVFFWILDQVYPVNGQRPGPEPGPMPLWPEDRVVCQTPNEFLTSKYRCYTV